MQVTLNLDETKLAAIVNEGFSNLTFEDIKPLLSEAISNYLNNSNTMEKLFFKQVGSGYYDKRQVPSEYMEELMLDFKKHKVFTYYQDAAAKYISEHYAEIMINIMAKIALRNISNDTDMMMNEMNNYLQCQIGDINIKLSHISNI